MGLGDAVDVGSGVATEVAVAFGVAVGVAVAVAFGVAVGVAVLVGEGVGLEGMVPKNSAMSEAVAAA